MGLDYSQLHRTLEMGLAALAEKGLVECIGQDANGEDRWILTNDGQKVINELTDDGEVVTVTAMSLARDEFLDELLRRADEDNTPFETDEEARDYIAELAKRMI